MSLHRFAALWKELEGSNSAKRRRHALTRYFRDADPRDASWALRLLQGQRPKRLMNMTELRALAAALSELPDWLYRQAEAAAGDATDAAALLVAQGLGSQRPLHVWLDELVQLRAAPIEQRSAWAHSHWRGLSSDQLRFLLKLATGGFRLRVPQGLLAQALAQAAGQPAWLIAYRLAQQAAQWDAAAYRQLLAPQREIPPPDVFAQAIDAFDPAQPPPCDGWCALPVGRGTAVQLLRRRTQCLLWSCAGEFVQLGSALAAAARALPADTVIEGEVLGDAGRAPRLMATDLLELAGDSLRSLPYGERHRRLAKLVAAQGGDSIVCETVRTVDSWSQLDAIWQAVGDAESLMLRRLDSSREHDLRRLLRYQPPAARIVTMLLYARLDGPAPELTLGVRDGAGLVPIARASARLADSQQKALLQWIRASATERFGPVVSLPPVQRFTLRFRSVQPSKRHKAGLALSEPVIERWEQGEPPAAVADLAAVAALLPVTSSG